MPDFQVEVVRREYTIVRAGTSAEAEQKATKAYGDDLRSIESVVELIPEATPE